MEKNDPLLRDSVQQRSDPIGACAQVAEKLNVPYFALQKGGQCFVSKSSDIDYERYQPSRKCKYGLGGQMANDVYKLKKSEFQKRFMGDPAGKNTLKSNSGGVSLCWIGIQYAMLYIAKNTLLQTAFPAILLVGQLAQPVERVAWSASVNSTTPSMKTN